MSSRRPATPAGRRPAATDTTASVPRLFAFTVPGLASLLAEELREIEGVSVQDMGFDGRSDVVLFIAGRRSLREVASLTLAEDVFVEIGRTLRSEGDRPAWVADRLFKGRRLERALTTRGQVFRTASDRARYRVISRVLQERSFLRTDLRRQVSATVAKQQPRWRFDDPADVEVWVVEYQHGKIIAGVRASDARMRQHEGRTQERSGALRPAVAAAMVRLAGEPDGALLDPCCGSGTVLTEADRAGWRTTYGSDIDPLAVEAARVNAPRARLAVADARDVTCGDGALAACVSNLPFGEQYQVQGTMTQWLRDVLQELVRATRSRGRVVLLAPTVPREVVPTALRLTHRVPIRLLGMKTTIWAYERASD